MTVLTKQPPVTVLFHSPDQEHADRLKNYLARLRGPARLWCCDDIPHGSTTAAVLKERIQQADLPSVMMELTWEACLVARKRAGAFEYLDHAVLFYEPQHGNQIEYHCPDARAYLWYPGNRGVVISEWRIEGEDYCERSPSNVNNPVTEEWGGQWERRPVRRLLATKVDAAWGDVFGLSTGRIPYRLHAHPGLGAMLEIEHPRRGQIRAKFASARLGAVRMGDQG